MFLKLQENTSLIERRKTLVLTKKKIWFAVCRAAQLSASAICLGDGLDDTGRLADPRALAGWSTTVVSPGSGWLPDSRCLPGWCVYFDQPGVAGRHCQPGRRATAIADGGAGNFISG